MSRIKAKNRITGVIKNFTKSTWDLLPDVVQNGRYYPKGGWTEVREDDISPEAKEVVKKATRRTTRKKSEQ